MPTFNLGDYGDETSDSDDEEAPPAAPVGRVRDNTPVLVQCTRAYQPAPAPAPAPAVKPSGANKRWTGADDAKLAELVGKHGSDWEKIAAELTSDRTPGSARTRWVRQSKPRKAKRQSSKLTDKTNEKKAKKPNKEKVKKAIKKKAKQPNKKRVRNTPEELRLNREAAARYRKNKKIAAAAAAAAAAA